MDPTLVARELEMALLAKLLEDPHVNAGSNRLMYGAALLALMRPYLGNHLTLADLERAVAHSPHLSVQHYNRPFPHPVDGMLSTLGICLRVHRWDSMATTQAPFVRRLSEHTARPRPPLAVALSAKQVLTARPVIVAIQNQGYGPPEAVQVQGVSVPDWVQANWVGQEVTLLARPAQGGAYNGKVVVHTNVNDVEISVSAEHPAFVLPDQDELWLDEQVPRHADLDSSRTEQLLELQLRRLGYERLPGGVFVRRGAGSGVLERTDGWWLTEADLRSGHLPAHGYPPSFTLYADADGKTDKYPFEISAQGGQLGGELIDYFDILAGAGHRLTLAPYRGGYKASLSAPEPWRSAQGQTFWLQGNWAEVRQHPELLDTLVRRSDEEHFVLNILLCGEGELPADLVRQHRAGRLSVRWTAERLPFRLLVCGGEQTGFYVPPLGRLTSPAQPPTQLWEAARPQEGQDYRESTYRRTPGGEPLLDLALSVEMQHLAQALRAVPFSEAPSVTAQEREVLLTELPRLANRYSYEVRPLHAARLLRELRLTHQQVAHHGNRVQLTQGGYLVPRPDDLGNLEAQCRYIGAFHGGIIHHSQLRKLVEAYRGTSLEPNRLLSASLTALGWAGNGYRRPPETWEPCARELTPLAGEVLMHVDQDLAATRTWLRRHIAATEEQLERALHKAQTKRAEAAPVTVLPVVQPAPPLRATVAPAVRLPVAARPVQLAPPRVAFQPLINSKLSLHDPRQCAQAALVVAVTQLVVLEGPMTESWLVRRYASLSRLNVKQVRDLVVQAAEAAVDRGELRVHRPLAGHVEFSVERQPRHLRVRGERQAEDITLFEWCELLRNLGVHDGRCDEAQAYHQAARAYQLGTAAAGARPLITLAYEQVKVAGVGAAAS